MIQKIDNSITYNYNYYNYYNYNKLKCHLILFFQNL